MFFIHTSLHSGNFIIYYTNIEIIKYKHMIKCFLTHYTFCVRNCRWPDIFQYQFLITAHFSDAVPVINGYTFETHSAL
jgi:hypothetical protein